MRSDAIGVACARACSLRRISACRYICVVSVDSCPGHRAITVRSTPCCRRFIAAVLAQRVRRHGLPHERRAHKAGGGSMSGNESLKGIGTEGSAAGTGKDRIPWIPTLF